MTKHEREIQSFRDEIRRLREMLATAGDMLRIEVVVDRHGTNCVVTAGTDDPAREQVMAIALVAALISHA